MRNFRIDFVDNKPSGSILEVLSGRYVVTHSETAITYDPNTGNIISILATAASEAKAESIIFEAAKQHLKSFFTSDAVPIINANL